MTLPHVSELDTIEKIENLKSRLWTEQDIIRFASLRETAVRYSSHRTFNEDFWNRLTDVNCSERS
jgi:hypothetical protein